MATPRRTAPPPPPAATGAAASTSAKAARWVRTHPGQAAGVGGVAAVAGYALYKRRQAKNAAASAGAVPAGAMATIQPYDPTAGGTIPPAGAGYSGASAGGVPTAADAGVSAQLAGLQAQLGSLTAAMQGSGALTPTGTPAPAQPTPASPTAPPPAAPAPPRIQGIPAPTAAAARQIDPNIGASSAADAAYLAGGRNATLARIQAIAANRGVTLSQATLGALTNRALAPAGNAGQLSLDQIRSQIDRGLIK